MAHTVDETTQAVNPGQIEIAKRKYLDYIGLTGIARLKYSFLLSLPQNVLFNRFRSDSVVLDFVRKTEHFKYGCINPTIVIDMKKGLIATFTSLTAYGEDVVPVIKISKEPLQLIKNMEVQDGQKLPTVALYARDPKNKHPPAWIDFFPKIANCFTDDINACNKILASVSDNAWECLAEGLDQVEDHEKIGLYSVELDDDLVRNAY